MLDQLQELRQRADAELARLDSLAELEEWRIAYLGKKGELTQALRGVGKLPPDERPRAGQVVNEIKMAMEEAFATRAEALRQAVLEQAMEEAFAARAEALRQAALEQAMAQGAIDVHLPGRPQSLGHIHASTRTLREIYDIFGQMGFQVLRSREVEDDMTNFQLLNIPPDHPARDMWSTYYLNRPGLLLRTHTSPGQIHAMRKYWPEPFRVVLPGKCYRYEQVSVRHDTMFYQVEGMVVGQNITMADLKGTLVSFARQMFGAERRLRFRPGYFPFTEPSAEADMDCILCGGKGCQVCKQSGWVEILGAGMVHPAVLRNGGYDPEKFSGFAFGMGPERIAMLKYGITDIRLFYANDLRFLRQFA